MSGSETGRETAAALEELYGVSRDEFIARRDALAKERKASGDIAGAAELKKRRRPTQIAWVLNQFARRRPADVAELADVGRELVREQRKALRGESGASFRASIDRQREVVKRTLERLGAVMKELGVDVSAHRDELASVVRSAIVDPAIALALEEGRLEKIPEVASAFGGLGEHALLGGASAVEERPKHDRARRDEAKRPDARTEAERKREREREREHKATRKREKEVAAAAAREEARAKRDAHARREAAKEAIRQARAELRAAEAEEKKSQAAATAAEHTARRVAAEAAEAERAARHLAGQAMESARRVTEAREALGRAEASA
jgi:hypothetical protein